MKILIVDDENYRHEGFKKKLEGSDLYHAYTYNEAVKFLQKYTFKEVYLDHDLGLGKNGNDVAQFITKLQAFKQPKKVFIHSWNPVGADNIYNTLTRAGILAAKRPYTAK